MRGRPEQRPAGLSIVIPTYNGCERLPRTLTHLLAQQGADGIRWEVVLVDNASTDGTAEQARALWPASAPAPLRIVREERQGLTPARLRGIRASRYELVCFVDDDNWVCPGWVATAVETMTSRPQVAACAGRNEPAFEAPPPAWFPHVAVNYAVGTLGEEARDVTDAEGALWGAGLVLRATAWRRLEEAGFRFTLSDRRGASLVSGGDTELCLALRRAGWRLWYEPRLVLHHFIARGRLDWEYCRRLLQGAGHSTPNLDPYIPPFYSASLPRRALRRNWAYQVLRTLGALGAYPLKTLAPALCLREGDPDVARVETLRGRLAGLLAERSRYTARFRDIDALGWHRARPGAPDLPSRPTFRDTPTTP